MKKIFLKKIFSIEGTVLAFVWILLFSIPLLFGFASNGINWDQVFRIWKENAFLLGAFLIHHYILLPKYFFSGKRVLYFASAIVLVIALCGIVYLTSHPMQAMVPVNTIPPDSSFGPGYRPRPKPGPMIPSFANMLIMSVLILGFDTGLAISMRWVDTKQKQTELEKENTKNKLAFLRTQISPHFFLNTLNNIHVLIDVDTEEAKTAVIKLSRLMSYLLYDSQGEKIALSKEITFVENYVELMRLRYPEKVDIILDIPDNLPPVDLPPLLFISFIENAFKHGISYQNESFIHIRFAIEKQTLWFSIKNSKHKAACEKEKGGIGIENSKNRLALLYGDKHILHITENENQYDIKMGIPI